MLCVGLALFLAIHLVPQNVLLKEGFVSRVGVTGYRIFHGVVTLVAIALVYIGYFASKGTFILWYPPIWTRHLAATLMLFAVIFLFAAMFKGKIKQKLISPLSIAIKTWAFAHLLANGELSDVILFGFFLIYAVSYRISLKRRIRAGLVTVPQGRWTSDLYAVALGLAFYCAMIFGVHEWAFGVSPLF
jgi:uncharacterized membrane protein